MAEDIFLPGKFTDLSKPEQIAQLNDLVSQMLDRLNQIDTGSIALAWLEGYTAGHVIQSQGVGNAPVWERDVLLRNLTLSSLTASQLVKTDGSKWLVSDSTNYMVGVGTKTITVGSTEPTSPAVGDIWIDTSA